jgi:cytochrome d ubiquinol oxidase subunit II
MADSALDLIPIWTLILAAGIFFYVLLDGFDLGVGMLYGFAPEASKELVMPEFAVHRHTRFCQFSQ